VAPFLWLFEDVFTEWTNCPLGDSDR